MDEPASYGRGLHSKRCVPARIGCPSISIIQVTYFSRYLLIRLAVMAAAHVGIVAAGRRGSTLLQADHAHNVCITVSELACTLLSLLRGASPGNGNIIVSSR